MFLQMNSSFTVCYGYTLISPNIKSSDRWGEYNCGVFLVCSGYYLPKVLSTFSTFFLGSRKDTGVRVMSAQGSLMHVERRLVCLVRSHRRATVAQIAEKLNADQERKVSVERRPVVQMIRSATCVLHRVPWPVQVLGYLFNLSVKPSLLYYLNFGFQNKWDALFTFQASKWIPVICSEELGIHIFDKNSEMHRNYHDISFTDLRSIDRQTEKERKGGESYLKFTWMVFWWIVFVHRHWAVLANAVNAWHRA